MNLNDNISKRNRILVIGSGRLACSVAVCLSQARESVSLLTDSITESTKCINTHYQDINEMTDWEKGKAIDITTDWSDISNISLAIVINDKSVSSKQDLIRRLETSFSENAIIAISTDYIPLEQFQKVASKPENVLIMNWAEPAHTTFFLELVYNEVTDGDHVSWLNLQAKNYWKKDPYTIKDELGVRGKMIAAMVREAFYLVENGYASVEDVDRACRNDAGMYMPFAGNFRYMDLMGTDVYGVVMEKLNEELSVERNLPNFFIEIINNENWGVKSQKGFHSYQPEDIKQWEKKARRYSYEIRELMEQYPFGD